jgi:hypothetical protein
MLKDVSDEELIEAYNYAKWKMNRDKMDFNKIDMEMKRRGLDD